MKILFYTYTLNKNSGGALKSNSILVDEFQRRGHEVSIVIHGKSDEDIDTKCDIHILKTKLGDLGRPFELKRIIKKVEPDVVIANMKPQNINLSLAKLFLGRSKIKFIGVERNPDLQFRYGKGRVILRKIMKKLYENLDVVVANSIATKEDLKKSFFVEDSKIEVIYNTVNFETLRQEARVPLNDEEKDIFSKKTIINIGRLTEQKRQDLLIEAFSKLDQKRYNLVIIGTGDKEEFLKKQAKALGVEGSVYFLGHKDNPFKYLKNSNIFVLTSRYEGFGRVVLESMAIDIPVIAFNSLGGHNELLENGCGVLVDYPNTDLLAKKIDELVDDKILQNSVIKGAKESLGKYSLNSHMEQFLKICSN